MNRKTSRQIPSMAGEGGGAGYKGGFRNPSFGKIQRVQLGIRLRRADNAGATRSERSRETDLYWFRVIPSSVLGKNWILSRYSPPPSLAFVLFLASCSWFPILRLSIFHIRETNSRSSEGKNPTSRAKWRFSLHLNVLYFFQVLLLSNFYRII